MGQQEVSGPFQDEKDELSTELLREWWMAATQALVDVVGSGKALELLGPGFRHHGRSGYHILTQFLGLKVEDLGTIAPVECLGKTLVAGSPAHAQWFEDGVIWTIEGCRTSGQCKEACLSYCYYAGVGLVENFAPELSFLLQESLSQGDQRCRALISKRANEPPTGELIKDYWPESLELSKAEWSFWCRASLGECWTIVTRAIEEAMGREEAMAILKPCMHQSGIALGKRIGWDEGGSDEERLLKAIILVQQSMNMEGGGDRNGRLTGEIVSCPFSGAPQGMCEQFETFLTGLCETVYPDYHFSYDSMMTKGDKTCHWMIKKKRRKEPSTRTEVDPEDPLKRLTNKFIDGEITKEEYEEKMALIKKHYSR